MTLSAAQLSLCFQSYWYMWLTNGLSGLLFIGIDIGIAAFFLKKFGNRKGSNYQRPPSTSTKRPFSATQNRAFDSVDENNGVRGLSAKSHDSGSSDENDDFVHATLLAVNAARSKYGVPPVELNEQLSEIAERWASHMARTGKLEHSPAEQRNYGRQTLGENFTAVFQTELTGDKMVRKWLKEGRRYDFGTSGNRDTENFTQLVWQATHQIGVGRAQSADKNWWYGVVVFDPPGNIPNQFAQNVIFN